MTISQNVFFAIIMLVAALRGYLRGWHREIITCAITLGSVLFLTIGGGDALAQLFTNLPAIFGGTGPTVTVGAAPPSPIFDFLILIGFTVLGHIAGSLYGASPKVQLHRLSGMMAGAVTGLALVYYITRQLLPATTINFTSPSTALADSWIVGLFGLGMIILLFLALLRK